MRLAVRHLICAIAIGSVLAACGATVESAPPSVPGSASVTAPTVTATAFNGPTPTPDAGTAVAIDPSLLRILPASVDGFPVVESPETEAAFLDDPLLKLLASAVAAGLAVEPTSGEFVYAVVVRLLPDAMDDAVFRDWRDSFDDGACSQADGVAGHAETRIGGRTVYIGTCTGGLRTYHVWLENRDVLISASAVGERRLGERLVENLRP